MDKIEICSFDVEYYFNLIKEPNPGIRRVDFEGPLKGLENLMKAYSNKKFCFEYYFVFLLHNNFEKIVKMSPESIEKWCNFIDSKYKSKFYSQNGDKTVSTKFTEKLIIALSYKKLQEKELKIHFKKHGINTCIYCNSQYTINYKNGKKEASNYQIDHIFPKSKYPFFSVSIFNLVPSCANCNLNKGSKNLNLVSYSHPYIESFGDLFSFYIEEDISKLTSVIKKEDELNINLSNKKDLKVKNHDELFDLSGIYSNFSNIAAEIIELGRILPKSKREELLNKYNSEKSGTKLIPDIKTLDRLILRAYPNSKAHNERPLSKFINDIARYGDYFKE
jgi:5-methylcytosine-specific restriction endonuclease McrA